MEKSTMRPPRLMEQSQAHVGDLGFVLRDKPHPIFRREGCDLRYTGSVIVSAPPAVTPTNHSVTTLTHGKTLPPAPPTPTAGPPPAAAPPAAIPSEAGSHKPSVTSVITSKKLTTLEAYPIRKSPIAAVGEVTIPAESTSSPAAIAEDDSGSAHDTRAPPSAAGAPAVGEFSGLVSYFSSQQDDYDT